MRRFIAMVGSVAVVLSAASIGFGQEQDRLREQRQLGQQPQQQQQLRGQQQAQAGQAGQIDEKLAAWLACGNRLEVELGQLAAERASNQQVKQFAQQMVQEHTQVLQQLRQINPQIEAPRGGQGAESSTQQQQQQQQQQAQRGAAAAQQAGGAGQDPLIQVAEQACRRKLELTRGLLEQKQGQDFDMAYMGDQIVAHIGMLSQLEASQNMGSQELQKLVSTTARATQQHLQQAMQIAETLKGEGGEERLTRRPQRGQQDQQDRQQDDRQQPDEE